MAFSRDPGTYNPQFRDLILAMAQLSEAFKAGQTARFSFRVPYPTIREARRERRLFYAYRRALESSITSRKFPEHLRNEYRDLFTKAGTIKARIPGDFGADSEDEPHILYVNADCEHVGKQNNSFSSALFTLTNQLSHLSQEAEAEEEKIRKVTQERKNKAKRDFIFDTFNVKGTSE